MSINGISVSLTIAALALALPTRAEADTANTPPLPDPEVLSAGKVIDCGQWPAEYEQDMGTRFRENCQKNSKLMGYSRAWTLTFEQVPQSVRDDPKSFRCRAPQSPNKGYACLGVKD